MNKYSYLWILQGQYGGGWEDLTAADTWKELRDYKKDYQLNEPGTPLRIIQRRELNNQS